MRTIHLKTQPGQTFFHPYQIVLKIDVIDGADEEGDDIEVSEMAEMFVWELPVDEDDLEDEALMKLLSDLGYDVYENDPVYTIIEWRKVEWIDHNQLELPLAIKESV